MAWCQEPQAQPGIPQKCRSSRRRWYGVSHWSSAVGMSSARSPHKSVKTLIRIGAAKWNPPESSNIVLIDAICTASLFFWLPRSGPAPDAPERGHLPPRASRVAGARVKGGPQARRSEPLTRGDAGVSSRGGGTLGAYHSRPGLRARHPRG